MTRGNDVNNPFLVWLVIWQKCSFSRNSLSAENLEARALFSPPADLSVNEFGCRKSVRIGLHFGGKKGLAVASF